MPPQTSFCPCRVSVRQRFLWEANRMLSNSMQYKLKNLSSFKCTNLFHTFGEKTGIYLLLQPSHEGYSKVHLGGSILDGYQRLTTAATFAGRGNTIACFLSFLFFNGEQDGQKLCNSFACPQVPHHSCSYNVPQKLCAPLGLVWKHSTCFLRYL